MSLRSKLRSTFACAAMVALVAAGCSASGDGGTTAAGGDGPVTTAGGDSPGTTEGGDGGGGGGGEEGGGGFAGAGGIAKLKEAAGSTAELTSYRMAMDMEMQSDMMSGTLSMEGAIDMDAEALQMSMDMSDFLAGMPGIEGMDAGDMVFEFIIIDDTMYMSSPMFEGQLPTKWISGPADELAEAGMFDSEQLDQGTAGADAMLDFLAENEADVTEEGREELRGVMTTKISTVLDTQKIIDEADPAEAAELEEQLDTLGGSLGEGIPIEVWIDDDNIVRKMSMDMSMDDPDMGSMEMTMTVELFDFGGAVEISAPSASDVTDMSAWMSQMGD